MDLATGDHLDQKEISVFQDPEVDPVLMVSQDFLVHQVLQDPQDQQDN